MSGKVRQRNAANAAESATVTVNERILRECHSLYTEEENGLVTIAESLGLKLRPPRKKISVMLIGNHSAGKSSFINWYIEEHVQRTGVAIETQGFTVVTSGKKRESLTGNATLHLFPYFKPLLEMEGVTDYLCTEISTSKQKKFSLVTFIDTPGLVDGDMKYPFDVNEAILWLGEISDLIFVFFDPIGQALCKRTLNIVENLNENHGERIRFYLSKADEAGYESDRQRVMMQIVQELCKRPGLNKCGFEMPTIYLPNPNKTSRCVNQIEEVCKDIEKTINQTIQNSLNTLEKDCELISELVDKKISEDNQARVENVRARIKGVLLSTTGLIFPVLLLISFFASKTSLQILNTVLGETNTATLELYILPLITFWRMIKPDYQLTILGISLAFCVILLLLARWCCSLRTTLTKKQKRILEERKDYVDNFAKAKKKVLYQEYLKQSVAEQDL